MNWYIERLKSMSFKEVVYYRSAQFFRKYILKKSLKPTELTFCKVRSSILRQYKIERLQNLLSPYSSLFEFVFFDAKVDLSKEIDWLKDYKNNKVSPQQSYYKINRQDFDLHGDVKYLAELSRFYHFPFFAFKYAATKEDIYLNLLKEHLKTWIAQNPFLQSIHWTSGIEVAVRSVNLIYAHLILRSLDLADKGFDSMCRDLLGKNYSFLKAHLSKYSSANNHLVAELCGLTIISSYFEGEQMNKEAEKWKELLLNEFFTQVLDDGVNMELSTRYHAEVLDHFFNAFYFLEKSGHVIRNNVYNRLKRSFEFVNDSRYNGHTNEFGDSDNGHLIYPYFDPAYDIYQSLIDTAKIRFDQDLNFSDKIDLRNYLIFGEKCSALKPAAEVREYRDKLYEKGGYCFMYDTRDKAKVSFDVGRIGDHLLSAHGHSDLLHFTFEVNGLPFIIDPGTFQYHVKDSFWRDYFRGTFAHNTISVDDKHHATPATRMSWINKPDVNIVNYSSTKESVQCVGEHEGFNDEYSNTKHRRNILMDRKNGSLIIEDHLVKRNQTKSKAEFLLHFHPRVKVLKEGNVILLNYNKTRLTLKNEYFADAKMYYGDESKPLGWYSSKFDFKEPTHTLSAIVPFEKSATIITTIDYRQK